MLSIIFEDVWCCDVTMIFLGATLYDKSVIRCCKIIKCCYEDATIIHCSANNDKWNIFDKSWWCSNDLIMLLTMFEDAGHYEISLICLEDVLNGILMMGFLKKCL